MAVINNAMHLQRDGMPHSTAILAAPATPPGMRCGSTPSSTTDPCPLALVVLGVWSQRTTYHLVETEDQRPFGNLADSNSSISRVRGENLLSPTFGLAAFSSESFLNSKDTWLKTDSIS